MISFVVYVGKDAANILKKKKCRELVGYVILVCKDGGLQFLFILQFYIIPLKKISNCTFIQINTKLNHVVTSFNRFASL